MAPLSGASVIHQVPGFRRGGLARTMADSSALTLLSTRLSADLQPNTEYLSVRVYGVYPRAVTNASNKPRYGAEFSLDAGSTWSDVDSHMAGSYTWVDNLSGAGKCAASAGHR